MMALFSFVLRLHSLEFQEFLEIGIVILRIRSSIHLSNTSFSHRLSVAIVIIVALSVRIITALAL